jgi:predicted alpha/beta hydrolase
LFWHRCWLAWLYAIERKIKVQVIWNIIFPPMVAITGYLPWSKLNMGADLPKGSTSNGVNGVKIPLTFCRS